MTAGTGSNKNGVKFELSEPAYTGNVVLLYNTIGGTRSLDIKSLEAIVQGNFFESTLDSPGISINANSNSKFHFFQNLIHRKSAGESTLFYIYGPSQQIYYNIFLLDFAPIKMYGIRESSATADPEALVDNVFIDYAASSSLNLYYDENVTPYTGICDDGKPGNLPCATGEDVAVATSENKLTAQASGPLFPGPKFSDITKDGPDGSTGYNGTTSRIEVPDCQHGRYVIGEFIEYDLDGVARQITGVDCTGTSSFIDFNPALTSNSQVNKPIRLWGSQQTNYSENTHVLLSTATTLLNQGPACPDDFSVKTFTWGTAADQAGCDSTYPHARSIFDSGSCVTPYLYPATELMPEDSLPGQAGLGNGNGLCEAGETCIYNPNIGAYAGHSINGSGSQRLSEVVSATCDVSSLLPGVVLMKYGLNGY